MVLLKRYVRDRRVVIEERDANNLPLVTYTRGLDLSGDLQEAGGVGGLLARTDRSTLNPQLSTAYYHCDGDGNVTGLLNASNAFVARYSYDPYGNLLASSGPLADVNLYRFSSKEYHPNSGLVYYLYRYYEPNLQRWVNRDPIEEDGGLNFFGFVQNGPTLAVDTDGLSLLMNTIRVCKQSGKLIRQIREKNFERAIEMTKESLQDMARHGEHRPVVHVPGGPAARDRTARALSDTGNLRGGVEQHGQYPPTSTRVMGRSFTPMFKTFTLTFHGEGHSADSLWGPSLPLPVRVLTPVTQSISCSELRGMRFHGSIPLALRT